jgi:hypothetical protein
MVVILPLILISLGIDMLFSAGSCRYSFFHVSLRSCGSSSSQLICRSHNRWMNIL